MYAMHFRMLDSVASPWFATLWMLPSQTIAEHILRRQGICKGLILSFVLSSASRQVSHGAPTALIGRAVKRCVLGNCIAIATAWSAIARLSLTLG